jgi:hypothetical protein
MRMTPHSYDDPHNPLYRDLYCIAGRYVTRTQELWQQFTAKSSELLEAFWAETDGNDDRDARNVAIERAATRRCELGRQHQLAGSELRTAFLAEICTGVTTKELYDAGFDHETIQKFKEAFKNGTKRTRASIIALTTPFLTKEQLQNAGIEPEKIEKFAELFPDGTEVTCEVCVKHPDVFSFGEKGGKLIRALNDIEEVHSKYDHDITDADFTYGARSAVAIADFRSRLRVERGDKDKIAGHQPHRAARYRKLAMMLYSPPRHPTQQEENTHKNNLERIEREHLLEQALAFYNASRYKDSGMRHTSVQF